MTIASFEFFDWLMRIFTLFAIWANFVAAFTTDTSAFCLLNSHTKSATRTLSSYFGTISFFKSVGVSYHSFRCEFERKKSRGSSFVLPTRCCDVRELRGKTLAVHTVRGPKSGIYIELRDGTCKLRMLRKLNIIKYFWAIRRKQMFVILNCTV